jgi:hypothetical protein
MGTGKTANASRTHLILILTLEPGSSPLVESAVLTVARFTAGLRLVLLDSLWLDRSVLLSSIV